MTDYSNELVANAINGDKQSLETLLTGVKDKVYNLSLRMLWNPSDAEDVTQEILIKVITNLSKFRMESKFSTWVYSIASNHLINIRKRGLEHADLSFEIFEKGIEAGFCTREPVVVPELDREILAEELKVSCTHAMLMCLNREDRMIYILSSMFGISSLEGSQILNLTPEAYRKRLSRIREKMRSFMESNCGLVNDGKPCRCSKRVEVAIETGRINPGHLLFVGSPQAENEFVGVCKDEMEEFDRVSAVFTSNPYYLTPDRIFQSIKKMITSGNYKILDA